ncbi:unnamed protein product, partial [Rotaria sp. Silwood2]
ITSLLSLREYGDPHLRSARANLLAKLIQIMFHLLTFSSLLNLFNNSFINPCSLVSIDSQDSSRLDIQLSILAELVSTFRSCLNDINAHVIHVSLNTLRTLLPVALAQLIDDIDFRILTYLEQQQQLKTTNRSWLDRCIDIIFHCLTDDDTRVRQSAASIFANVLRPTTIRPFFHNQYDELRLLIHFIKNPFILHDFNNLQLLLDIINLIFSNLSNNANDINDIQSAEKIFHFLIKILSIFACVVEDTIPSIPQTSKINFPPIPGSSQQIKICFESSTNDSSNSKIELFYL